MKKILILLLISANIFAQKNLDSLFRAKDTNLKGLSKNDYSNTEKAKIALTTSKNLFDKNKAIDGCYMGNDGGIAYNSSYGISDYIPVTAGLQYTAYDAVNTLPMRFTTYFDANKSVVSGGSNVSTVSFTCPTGVAYIRITYNIGINQGKNFFQLEQAASSTIFASGESLLFGNYSVSGRNIPIVSKSKNLFDKSKVLTDKYMGNDGNILSLSTYYVSDFIEVISGFTYYFWDGEKGARFTTYFNENKAVVSGGSNSAIFSALIPSGVKYIRITSWDNSVYNKNSLQVELGNARTTYTPFDYTFETHTRTLKKPFDAVFGRENLKSIHHQLNIPSERYDIICHGDSYTHGGYYTDGLYNEIFKYFNYGGVGFCSFASANNGTLASQSVAPNKLYATRGNNTHWVSLFTNTAGLDASETTSQVSNAAIAVTSTEGNASIDIFYKRISGGGSFNWNINGGSNTTVSCANATTDIQKITIDVSSYTSGYTINIIALASNVTLYGVFAKNTNGLSIHKAGMTGGQAINFGKSALFQTLSGYISPKLVTFMYGTNEINANILPSDMKLNIQIMVNYHKAINPNCDFIFMCPNEQTYGSSENLRTYTTIDYSQAMYELAIENRAAFIDFRQIFPPFSQSAIDGGYIHSDRVHPASRGNSTLSMTILSLLVNNAKMFLTTSQRDAIKALSGLTIYNTTTNKIECFDGTTWQVAW